MDLVPLDDPRWKTYEGGYKQTPFDCVSLIRQLQTSGTNKPFWDTVWNELHHQGDVGEATYAFIPYLARDSTAKNQPAEIAMFQISEVQEAPAFNGRRSFLTLRDLERAQSLDLSLKEAREFLDSNRDYICQF